MADKIVKERSHSVRGSSARNSTARSSTARSSSARSSSARSSSARGSTVKGPPLNIPPDVQLTPNTKIVAQREGTSPAVSCAVFPKSMQVAIGWSDGDIEVLNSDTLTAIDKLESSNKLPVTFLSAYTPEDEKQLLLSSFATGETIMWNIDEGNQLWKITEERQSLVNSFNCDKTKFAVGGSDAKVNVYDVADQKLFQVLQGSMDPEVMDGHTMRVFSIQFHPSREHEVVTGGWDDTVQFWDIREPFSRRKFRGPHICGDGIKFLDENRIITASWKKKNPLQIWDYRTEKLINNITPDDYTCFLYCCQFVEDERILLTGGSHKNMVRVIDSTTLKSISMIRGLNGAVYFVKEFPKRSPASLTSSFCFCSDKSVYGAEVEVLQ